MVFFLNADEAVYARYGGRDPDGADNRQSLEGLKYTMESVLKMHQRPEKQFAPKSADRPQYLRDLAGGRAGGGRCLHCHQVKEALNRKLVADGSWSRDQMWRYPLPENLGLKLELHRGNLVEKVTPASPAAQAGLKPGDVLRRMGAVPIHSFGDAQFALDKAPAKGTLDVAWERGGQTQTGALALAEGWRKSDVRWRPSMRRLVPNLPLYGDDLTTEQRKPLGLTEKQLAFRQKSQVTAKAREAGFQAGDVILGIDGLKLEMDAIDFLRYVRREYVVGDTITLTVLRDGKTLKLPLVLSNR
jgi:predicted metalloprotease with PDZ domain